MFIGTKTKNIPQYRTRWVQGIGDLAVCVGQKQITLHCYRCEHCDRVAEVQGKAIERFYCRDCNHLIGVDD